MEHTLGKRIMHHRKRLGLTQDQLAEKLGVTAQAVSKWENDQSCPDITLLPRLAQILGITTDELLGIAGESPVREGEVVEEKEAEGIHIQKGNWEFQWDGGRKHAMGFALLVLLVGAQLILAKILLRDLSFWAILWPTAVCMFGITGLFPSFSVFRLGCILFGSYLLLDRWQVLPFNLGGELVFPIVLVLFGFSLLIDATKKPKKPVFHFHQKGSKAMQKPDYQVDGEAFSFFTSFSDTNQYITMPCLASGNISISFGDSEIDLSGVEQLHPDCHINASCSFGDLDILVPRRFAVEMVTDTTFADINVSGTADPQPQGVIHLYANARFGDISIRYI